MSSVFDTLQQMIIDFIPDGDVQNEARLLVGALHDYSHRHDDALNFENPIRVAGARLDKALDRDAAASCARALARYIKRVDVYATNREGPEEVNNNG